MDLGSSFTPPGSYRALFDGFFGKAASSLIAVIKCLSDSRLFHTAHLMGARFVHVMPRSLCQSFTALSHWSYKQLFWCMDNHLHEFQELLTLRAEYEMTCTTGTLNDCCRHVAAAGLHTCAIPRLRNFQFTI